MPVVSTGQITIIDLHDGLNLLLSNPAHVLPSNDQGVIASIDYANCVCTAQVMKGPLNVTADWNISIIASTGIAGVYASNTYSVTALTAESAYVDFTATRSGEPTLTQRFSVTRSKNAADGLSIIVSNESHVVASDSAGTVSGYTGSGTTIRVLEGSVELNAASSSSANGSFTVGAPVVSPSGKITVGGRSYSSKTATIANHSAMAADTDSVTITYPVNIRRLNGVTVSLSKTQTITKSKQGVAGGAGKRGTVHVYWVTAGTVWSDSEADAALAMAPHNGKIVADRVTLYNSNAGWTETRYWTGTAWLALGEVIDGNLLVTGSITADKININDVFARTIALPDGGVIRAGTTTYAEMGGNDYFAAIAGTETIFRIGRQNNHFINGKHITQTLPWQAFDSTVIPYIREQLAIGAPSAGGSISGSGSMGSNGAVITTSSTLASAGSGVPVSFSCSYGGFIDLAINSVRPTLPVLTVQIQRITNGGSPVNIGAAYQYTGSAKRGPLVDDTQYEWDVSIPNFNIVYTDSSPGSGNISYRAFISITRDFTLTTDFGVVNLSASQQASGAISGTVAWGNILGVPNLSLVGHTHSAGEVGANNASNLTTGILPDGRLVGAYTGLTSLTSERYIANSNDRPALQANTNYSVYGYGFSTTVNANEIVLIATVTVTGSSRNYLITGSLNFQSSNAYGLIDFRLAIRANTITGKNLNLVVDNANNGRDAQIYVYNDTASGNVYICMSATQGSQNLNGKIELYSRENYSSNITVQNSKVLFDPTGLTQVVAESTRTKSTTYNLSAPSFVGPLTGNASTASSISGFNNPTVDGTANTIAYRDSSGNLSATLFRSSHGDTSVISGAMAFRVNNGSDNYIRYCSNQAAIRSWLDTNNANNLTAGTLPNARLGSQVSIGSNTLRHTLSVATDNSGAVDTSLHMGYIPLDYYGFRFLQNSHASNLAAGTLRLQRGTAGSWADVLTVDNGGSLFLNNNHLYLRGNGDTNHGIVYNTIVDGPEIKGNLGGRLASSMTGNIALRWDQNGYLFAGAWLNMPQNAGFFWNNGTHLMSVGSGKMNLYGSENESWIKFGTNGDVTRGYLYAEANADIGFLTSSGSWRLRVTNSGVSYGSDFIHTSDGQVKSNQQRIPDALQKVRRYLTGKTFNRTDQGGKRSAGYIAQDLQMALPEAVDIDSQTGMLSVNDSGTIGLLIEAVKELADQVDKLRGSK